MLALIRFLFLCALAIASGVAAVTIEVGGRTPAEHVRHYVHVVAGVVDTVESRIPAAAPAHPAAPHAPKVATHRTDERPPADPIKDDERAALDHLIGEKSR